jgi:hypothetical protein
VPISPSILAAFRLHQYLHIVYANVAVNKLLKLRLARTGAGAPALIRARRRAPPACSSSSRRGAISAVAPRRRRVRLPPLSRGFFANSRDVFRRLHQELRIGGHAGVGRHALHGPRRERRVSAAVMMRVARRALREVQEVPAAGGGGGVGGAAEEARGGVVRDGGCLGRGVGAEPQALPRAQYPDLRHPLPPPPPPDAPVPAPPRLPTSSGGVHCRGCALCSFRFCRVAWLLAWTVVVSVCTRTHTQTTPPEHIFILVGVEVRARGVDHGSSRADKSRLQGE